MTKDYARTTLHKSSDKHPGRRTHFSSHFLTFFLFFDTFISQSPITRSLGTRVLSVPPTTSIQRSIDDYTCLRVAPPRRVSRERDKWNECFGCSGGLAVICSGRKSLGPAHANPSATLSNTLSLAASWEIGGCLCGAFLSINRDERSRGEREFRWAAE